MHELCMCPLSDSCHCHEEGPWGWPGGSTYNQKRCNKEQWALGHVSRWQFLLHSGFPLPSLNTIHCLCRQLGAEEGVSSPPLTGGQRPTIPSAFTVHTETPRLREGSTLPGIPLWEAQSTQKSILVPSPEASQILVTGFEFSWEGQ